jgi:hypothetical protein
MAEPVGHVTMARDKTVAITTHKAARRCDGIGIAPLPGVIVTDSIHRPGTIRGAFKATDDS